METNINMVQNKKKRHMLALGKNIPYLKMIKSYFEKVNYSVVTANSFRRAHGILKNQTIDCMLLDVAGAYGEVLRFVKNCRSEKGSDSVKADIAVMLILEYEDKRFIHKALEVGADDYVCNNQDFSIVKLRLDLLLERNFYRRKVVDLQNSLPDSKVS